MVLVGHDQEQHHSFRDLDDCEELRYLTLLVPLIHVIGLFCSTDQPTIYSDDSLPIYLFYQFIVYWESSTRLKRLCTGFLGRE